MTRSTSAVDWKSETTEEVADGVFRIPLPMPNDGLAAVNTYLLLDGDGPVLVDPGVGCPRGARGTGARSGQGEARPAGRPTHARHPRSP